MNLDELYVTQVVKWRHHLCYITNIFVNGKIVISPKGINKYYTVHYTEIEMTTYKALLPELEIKYKTGHLHKVKLTNSKDVHMLFREIFNADTIEYTEEFIILLLNQANITIGWRKISQGGINGTIADPRTIFGLAVQCGASGIICAHNHPSGQIIPSDSDKALTKQLKEGGKLLQINILDHLILGVENTFYSFRDNGQL